MKKTKQLLSLFIALIMTCSLLSIAVSAADITLSKTSCSVTEGKKTTITVSGVTDVNVKSSSSFIATASYSSDKKTITITGKHYGTAKITVTSKKDKAVTKTITVNVDAPVITTGTWVEEDEGYYRFKKTDGKYATGWNTIVDDSGTNTYYFYPNGVLFYYYDIDTIMYNNQSYYMKDFRATGKKGSAYIYSQTSKQKSSLTHKTSAKTYYNATLKAVGEDYIAADYGLDAPYFVSIFNEVFFPGLYEVQVPMYSFYNENASDNYDITDVLSDDISKHLFANMSIAVDYSKFGKIEKTFYQEKYLSVALNEAFGQTVKKTVTTEVLDSGYDVDISKGAAYYTWTNVGAEKATVDVYFDKNRTFIYVY